VDPAFVHATRPDAKRLLRGTRQLRHGLKRLLVRRVTFAQ